MNDHLIGGQRGMPLHAPAAQNDAAENTAQNKDMQAVAAVDADVQLRADAASEDYTISVEQVREHFRTRGLDKSKDTVQRWCRKGDLTCQKRGVLGRYFTTEASLLALEKKLLPDMIAENAGVGIAVSTGTPEHAADASYDMQVHEADKDNESAKKQQHAVENAAERSGMSEQVQVHPTARTDLPMREAAEVAELQAQVAGLTSQLEQVQVMNEFLKEEIVSARGQRGDVVKIAEQMLGTLETIAVGGRLEKPSAPTQSSDPNPVRYQQVNNDPSAV